MYKQLLTGLSFSLLAMRGMCQQGIAVLQATSINDNPSSSGIAIIDAANENDISVTFSISNFPPGGHAAHIHNTGDITADDGTSTQGHFNPYAAGHACDEVNDDSLGSNDMLRRHVGDMGTFEGDGNGKLEAVVTNNLPRLKDPTQQSYVVGRSIVFHVNPDDCESQPHGGAGDYILMGVIGIRSGSEPTVNDNAREVMIEETVARMDPYRSSGVSGQVVVLPVRNSNHLLFANLKGLTPGQEYGIRAHQYGDKSDIASGTLGDAFNPTKVSPVCDATQFHGFLGNFVADDKGEINVSEYPVAVTATFSWSTSINGRGFSVTSNPRNCGVEVADILAVGINGMRPISQTVDPNPSDSSKIVAVSLLLMASQLIHFF